MKNQELRYIDLLRLREETFKYFTEEESLKAVREDGWNLAYVKYQTPEICQEAVKQNGMSLQFVINQTEELCLEAYKKSPDSVQLIRIDIKDETLRKKREEWFRYFTLEESLEAVNQNGFALRYIKHQTDEICLEAVRQNGWVLDYVKHQTPDICIEAYKNDPESIMYIRDTLEAYRKRRLNLISSTFQSI